MTQPWNLNTFLHIQSVSISNLFWSCVGRPRTVAGRGSGGKRFPGIFLQVVPTTGPTQTWPISISAQLLAPFPDPTMHNIYICHKKLGCVRKCEARAQRVPLWPFWHHFAPFWQANGASPNLLQSCRFSELKLLLHDDSMLQRRIRGRRSGRCVPWVTLSRPDKGPNTGNAISLQHKHAFKPDQVWELQAIKSNLRNFEMEPIEGVGGKRWAKTFPNVCLFWVHSSTGQLLAPKFTQDVQANFAYLQAPRAWSLGLGVENSAHSSNQTYLFSKIAFHSPHQFRPQEHLQNQKNISYPIVCSDE